MGSDPNGSVKSAEPAAFQSTLPRGERPETLATPPITPPFQSTLPRGERHPIYGNRATFKLFQSTLPRGERPPSSFWRPPSARFQSTLPRGERPCSISSSIWTPGFQSTLPRGERRSSSTALSRTSCFNPRSRVGSDEQRANWKDVEPVSIHAPAWGATRFRGEALTTVLVSIHAPAWGATPPTQPFFPPSVFQSTLPRGERRAEADRLGPGIPVSIHAPAWGATRAGPM